MSPPLTLVAKRDLAELDRLGLHHRVVAADRNKVTIEIDHTDLTGSAENLYLGNDPDMHEDCVDASEAKADRDEAYANGRDAGRDDGVNACVDWLRNHLQNNPLIGEKDLDRMKADLL